ncbi:MAG: Hsp20/alpha crystallin family protein [Planctomycetota bacterium]
MLWSPLHRTPADWTVRPWQELARLSAEMNRMLADPRTAREDEFPPLRVWATEEGLRLEAQLPGFAQDSLEISVLGDTLTLRGTRENVQHVEGDAYHRRERGTQSFARTLTLPHAIEVDAVKATYKKGVLEIELPRAQSERPRKIAVANQ